MDLDLHYLTEKKIEGGEVMLMEIGKFVVILEILNGSCKDHTDYNCLFFH